MRKTSKILSLLAVLVLICALIVSCGEDAPVEAVCQHRDINDDSLCDKCNESYTDGKDVLCQHRDIDDDGFCDKCDERYSDGKDVEDEHTHSFALQSVEAKYLKSAADCENAATYYYSCSCGEIGVETYESGSPLGHDEVSHEAKAPTCLEGGYDAYVTCTRCDYTTYSEKAALGHNYLDGICSRCGDIKPSEGLRFTQKNDGTYEVSGIGTCTDTKVVIPATYNDKNVTSIGSYAFSDCSSLTSITIPDSVTSIGSYAFKHCSKLTSVYITDIVAWCNIDFVDSLSNPLYYAKNLYLNGELVTELVIPEGVTAIKEYAFCGCSSLTSVTIPDSVTSIGKYAFSGCSSLKYNEYDNAYYLGNSSNHYLLLVKAKDTSITSCTIHNDTKFIHSFAFYECSKLTSVTIPDSVTSIGEHAFYYCFSLTSVTIGNGVTSIGNYAFADCSSLTSVTIPDSVTKIGYHAFYGCSSLASVTIPDSVTKIGDNAFSGCSSLKYNEYDNAYYLGNSSNPYLLLIKAKDKSIASCTIHNNTKFIYQSAFSGCSSLTSVTIPDSVTSIGSFAFSSCSSLTSVTIPNSVTSIGSEAFYNCSSLTSITIPDSVASIEWRAFRDCSSLTSVTIPDSVTSIDWYAFLGCISLTRINYSGTKEEWKAIEKGDYWKDYTGSFTVYCSDGNLTKSEA